VLKYRTRPPGEAARPEDWPTYWRAVQTDARQAVRILRKNAAELGLAPARIGVCGFSAGGQLALACALEEEGPLPEGGVSGRPDFAGLFYPGIPADAAQLIERRTAANPGGHGLCPIFIINARDDQITPAAKCVELYAALLKAGAPAELHVFGKGSHGFDLGTGRGESAATWPECFVAWLHDTGLLSP
jgi:acetyl esterase/lipase